MHQHRLSMSDESFLILFSTQSHFRVSQFSVQILATCLMQSTAAKHLSPSVRKSGAMPGLENQLKLWRWMSAQTN
jgi:hypothetical protein